MFVCFLTNSRGRLKLKLSELVEVIWKDFDTHTRTHAPTNTNAHTRVAFKINLMKQSNIYLINWRFVCVVLCACGCGCAGAGCAGECAGVGGVRACLKSLFYHRLYSVRLKFNYFVTFPKLYPIFIKPKLFLITLYLSLSVSLSISLSPSHHP